MTRLETPFDSVVLASVIDEVNDVACGLTVQRVVQTSDTDVVLSLRGRTRDVHLLVSWDAVYARMHLVSQRGRGPSAPPAFCMALRKHLVGSHLARVAQVDGDRIARLTFAFADARLQLVGEFMGRHSNLLLLDGDGVILECGKHVTHRTNRHRQSLPGLSYVRPPLPSAGGGVPFASEHDGARLPFLGPFAQAEISARQSSAEAIERRHWAPVEVIDGAAAVVGAYPFALATIPEGAQRPAESLSLALDKAFAGRIAARCLDDRRRRLRGEIEAAIRARRKTLGEPGDVEKLIEKSVQHRREADLLLAAGPETSISNGAVILPDLYGDGSTIAVQIDPRHTIQDAAERLYRLARKARDRSQWLARAQSRVGAEISALGAALDILRGMDSADEIDGLEVELVQRALIRGAFGGGDRDGADHDDGLAGSGVRRIVTESGWTILVGRNSEGNDYLLRHLAAPNDTWLHVRGGASAHVVVRARGGGMSPPIEVLTQAALLSARNSRAKHSGTVAVDYTLRKYVRKPKGSAPGAVTYRCERTLHVDPRGGAD